jgi:hypothetical protein
MESFDKKLLTPNQLCDALEVHLGAEKGKKKCRELLDELKADPEWRAELDTLGCTVQVYQRIEAKEVPIEVSYRLKKSLNLKCDEDGDCK